jgi:hypothetical protein
MAGKRIAIVSMAAILLAAIAAGCGGGDSSASEDSGNTKPTTESEPPPFGTRPGREVVNFGEEADQGEREAGFGVLEESYRAREAGEWAKQCASMTLEQSEEVRETTEPNGTCASGLRTQATPLAKSKAFRAYPIQGQIEAFRVKGELGFVLYHGKDGSDYAMAMKKEGGKWLVDDLIPTKLPKST